MEHIRTALDHVKQRIRANMDAHMKDVINLLEDDLIDLIAKTPPHISRRLKCINDLRTSERPIDQRYVADEIAAVRRIFARNRPK